MTNIRRALEAAAAVGGDDATYVEDVFSPYVYTGTGATKVVENGIALGDTNAGACVEFDGTNDWLTRTSDFSGNADGNSFTFSCWCFKAVDGVSLRVFTNGESSGTDSGLLVYAGNDDFAFYARDDTDTTILGAHAYSNILKVDVWTNVLISIDLSSASNRYIYFNDVDVTSSFTFGTYTDDDINFTTTTQSIAKAGGISTQLWQGRLSSLFLDYTYRDLSVTGNRRLFITADGQPAANQASLSPIMFMPLDDTNAIGKNLGTGGDFTVNGSPTALSQGGPYIDSGYGQGGMVWIKNRTNTNGHRLVDTARGVLEVLESYDTTAETTEAGSVTAFNTTGFTVGDSVHTNEVDDATASWAFRKAPGFFDIVEYTGNGSAQTIAHSLGSTPGMIIVKNLDSSTNWETYHRKLNGGTTPEEYKLEFNETAAESANSNVWNDTAPTSTHFTVGTNNSANLAKYVAYLFAHDDQIFGADEDESIIKCGSFTTTASWGNYKEDIGWEPQYVLMKDAGDTGDWFILDSIRGIVGPGDGTLADTSAFYNLYQTSDDAELKANSSGAESDQGRASLYSQGIIGALGFGNRDFIYMAIRRPMKVPTAATDVFAVATRVSANPNWVSNFVVDAAWQNPNTGLARYEDVFSRLTGLNYIQAGDSAGESAGGTDFAFDFMTGWRQDGSTISTAISWMWQRAPEFMDVICYTGNSTADTAHTHNLTVAPEMMIFVCRNQTENRLVYHKDSIKPSYTALTTFLKLNEAHAYDNANYWSGVSATTVTTGSSWAAINKTGDQYIAYLFVTIDGISMVGSYTADGTLTTIDCGFSAGARFVLIKRTDVNGDWYLYDSLRGIVAGNDPYLIVNTETAETTGTDYIDPDNSGFQITAAGSSTINVDTGTYIFLAMA